LAHHNFSFLPVNNQMIFLEAFRQCMDNSQKFTYTVNLRGMIYNIVAMPLKHYFTTSLNLQDL
jgi:hypothetical protein